MEILKNSVWKFSQVDGFGAGLYRVLHIYHDINMIVVFPILEGNALHRPSAISLDVIDADIKAKNAVPSEFKIPEYMQRSEEQISGQHRTKRDHKYSLIKTLIDDPIFLFTYATQKRVNKLGEVAKAKGSYHKELSRLLNLYWRYGQDKNALLPAYSKSGGAGKERTSKGGPLGAPQIPRTLAIDNAKPFVLKQVDKDNMRKVLNKYYFKPNGKTLIATHDELVTTYYSEDVKSAKAKGERSVVPSYRQLVRYRDRLHSPDAQIKLRSTEADFLLKKRSLLGSVIDDSTSPGYCFEIDATVADVHIVSSFRRQALLGRPTIYSLVDRASSEVVGIHVSLLYASWRAARQAIANAFLSKVDYCKEFGIEISESEWPAAHIPLSLMCDRGEMIGLGPEELVVPLTELNFAPPYRPDFKAMVERKFGLFNESLIHGMLGTTRGGKVVQGDGDPRKKANYTLKDFTTLLIDEVIKLNNKPISRLATTSPLLIANDLPPTPNNYWQIHLAEHRHSLKKTNPTDVISQLYPPAEAFMTKNGIEYNNMFYSSERVRSENLASQARENGRRKLEARINENTTNYIYVRFEKNQSFERCDLLPKSKMLRDQPMYEAEYVRDWTLAKTEAITINAHSEDSANRRAKIDATAKKRAQNNTTSFVERSRNIRHNRKNEIELTTNSAQKSAKKPRKVERHLPESRTGEVIRLLPTSDSVKRDK